MFNSTISSLGARGPSFKVKLFLYRVVALSDASFNKLNEPVAPPLEARAQTTPMVTRFTAPGSKVNEPAVCKKRLSCG